MDKGPERPEEGNLWLNIETAPVLRRCGGKEPFLRSLFTLGAGIVRMLETIMYEHTGGKSEPS